MDKVHDLKLIEKNVMSNVHYSTIIHTSVYQGN